MSSRGLLPLALYLVVLLGLIFCARVSHELGPEGRSERKTQPVEAATSEELVRPTEVLRPSRDDPPAPAPAPPEDTQDEDAGFRVPSDWCGTGRVDSPGWSRRQEAESLEELRRLLRRVDVETSRGISGKSRWIPTEEPGIYRRIVTRHEGGLSRRVYEYGRRIKGTLEWETWSREEEWERRRRARSPK